MPMSKRESILRHGALALCELFTVGTIAMLLMRCQYGRLPVALVTLPLLLLPSIVERMVKRKLLLPTYMLGLFYALGPMLGQCHNLYYNLTWWDKLLHTLGGVVFAILGVLLFENLAGTRSARMTAVFALCFSMAVSVGWEFYEYGADTLLGTDMQQDTVVHQIHSYKLGHLVGEVGSLENIHAVQVNGEKLPFDGYLDIGLHDTMKDMLLETLGALLVALVHMGTKGRCRIFKAAENTGKPCLS